MSNKIHPKKIILEIRLTYQARRSASAKNIAGHFCSMRWLGWRSPSPAYPALRFSPVYSHHYCWCFSAKISPSSFYIFLLVSWAGFFAKISPSSSYIFALVSWAGLAILMLKHWGADWQGAWMSFLCPKSLEPFLIFLLLDSRGSKQGSHSPDQKV